MSVLEKAKRVILENYHQAKCGIFDSRNFTGDEMITIYDDDELTIDICYHYGYFEVFGLTDLEFSELESFYDRMVEIEPFDEEVE